MEQAPNQEQGFFFLRRIFFFFSVIKFFLLKKDIFWTFLLMFTHHSPFFFATSKSGLWFSGNWVVSHAYSEVRVIEPKKPMHFFLKNKTFFTKHNTAYICCCFSPHFVYKRSATLCLDKQPFFFCYLDNGLTKANTTVQTWLIWHNAQPPTLCDALFLHRSSQAFTYCFACFATISLKNLDLIVCSSSYKNKAKVEINSL